MQPQIDEFLRFLRVEKGYSKHTIAAYRTDVTQFLTYLEGEAYTSWPSVGRRALLRYITHLQAQEYARATVARKIAAVKSFFHFLVADGVLKEDPAAAVPTPSVTRHLPHPLSPKQVASLLAQPAEVDGPRSLRDWALLELMYATGMRASEVIGLDVENVDLEAQTVRCLGKGNKERILPLYDHAVEVLRIYLTQGRPALSGDAGESALFLNHRGDPLTRQGLWLIVKDWAAAAGLERDVTPHVLRHTFATHMLNGGAGLREVQQLLGHANISTTQIYTEVSTRRKRSAYDKAHPRA
jgi:integrase/recombinase XerD